MYFLLIRPQQKKAHDHRKLIDGIAVDDKVCLSSGVFGTVRSLGSEKIIGTDVVEVEIAQGVVIKVAKDSIASCTKS